MSGADFKLTTPPDAVVPGLGAVQLTITFTPSSAQQQSTGSLTLQMAGAGAVASYSFFLVGAGQNANLVASYILNPDGNQIPVGGGGTITFPQTAIRATTTATFVVVNRGNGPGAVNNATVTGDQFRITGLPLLPFSIDPGKDFRFTVAFTPVSRDVSRGSLQVALGTGALTVSLVGQGAGAAFAYEFVTSSGSTPVAPGGAIKLPDTAIGAVSSGVVRVRNTGNADGRVGAVAVVGSAFRLADLPPLPANVPQGGALTFTVQFAPRESGPAIGAVADRRCIAGRERDGGGGAADSGGPHRHHRDAAGRRRDRDVSEYRRRIHQPGVHPASPTRATRRGR